MNDDRDSNDDMHDNDKNHEVKNDNSILTLIII